MLTVMDHRPNRNCGGYCRREFLRIGGLGLGGLALPGWLAARAGASQQQGFVRDKAVVLLFLAGGPPQHETFDPKMSAPSEIRSTTGEIATSLPGLTFGSDFPKLAQRAHRLAVVRSYGSDNGGHSYDSTVTASNPLKAAASAIYARLAGTNHPETGMPSNAFVLPEAVQPGLKFGRIGGTGDQRSMVTPGTLGALYEAFNPAGGSALTDSMELRISPNRFADRRSLLGQLDTLRRQADATGIIEKTDYHQQQAFDIVTRGLGKAFDLSQEDPRTLERYDTRHVFKLAEWQKYANLGRATNLLGHQMLMARRLVEAGCGFVTVSDCGWDMHADGSSAPAMTAMGPLGGQVDHAVTAFLDDVEHRGLSDRILLIITGEMGRNPVLNAKGGREHWGALTPLVFAGGGLNMGQVIGQSDRRGGEAATERYTPKHLLGTIMHTLFDIGQLRLDSSVPNDLAQVVTDSKRIDALFA